MKPQNNHTIPPTSDLKPTTAKKDVLAMVIQFLTAFIVFVLVLNIKGYLPTGSIIDNQNVIKYSNIYISGIFTIATALLAICYLHFTRLINKNGKLFVRTKN